ncbi:MAG: hypothetical protein FJX56_12565 [Alphaproteobacteria bacterium]|nr:hypothetical protein [Alphaproteobacteria bacterium]
MYRVNHNMKHVAEEFMQKPIGHHSPELQRVLMVFRGEPLEGKYVLVCTKPFKEWTLGQLTGVRGKPVKLLKDKTFTSIEDAEREVFRLRWKKYTGHELNL